MRELTSSEIDFVSGSSKAGDIAFTVASGWVLTVAGYAVGTTLEGTAVAGPVGAAVGFILGTAIGVGYILAQRESGSAPSTSVTIQEMDTGGNWQNMATTDTTQINSDELYSQSSGTELNPGTAIYDMCYYSAC